MILDIIKITKYTQYSTWYFKSLHVLWYIASASNILYLKFKSSKIVGYLVIAACMFFKIKAYSLNMSNVYKHGVGAGFIRASERVWMEFMLLKRWRLYGVLWMGLHTIGQKAQQYNKHWILFDERSTICYF